MKKKTTWILILLVSVVGLAVAFIGAKLKNHPPQKGKPGQDLASRPIPVAVATARSGDLDVEINALGTVTALNTATIKPRVDGLIVKVNLQEGQIVKAGDLLVEIDPRPFQVLHDHARGQLMRDKALLENARLDQKRNHQLLKDEFITQQQSDAQDALVAQYEGTVISDQAQVDSAKLNLEFTRVTAPISGRIGLRLVDVGNMVHANDLTGLAIITQTQPITVIFAIPSNNISAVAGRSRANEPLVVEAIDRDGKKVLATGKLVSMDNQIDTTTGTVKLRAEFENSINILFPNQFVNVHLRIETLHGATLVPTAAVQRGTIGTFFYVVDNNKSVEVRQAILGPMTGDVVAVMKGLSPGERVVVDGADKLRGGVKVELNAPGERGAGGKEGPGGNRNQQKGPGGA